MITKNKKQFGLYKAPSENPKEYRGKSTDVKPIEGVPNGSVFWEFDKGNVYAFDAETSTWILQ